MVTSIPLANTRAAASGSSQMLNSAAGVTLPSAIAPPISTMRSITPTTSGCRASSSAMFVSGPVGTTVIGADAARSRSARKSTAWVPTGAPTGAGRSGPSSPLSPCTDAATIGSRISGRLAPAATSMSPRPASSSTRRAFAVVLSSVWLPWTVVTPSTSTSGLASASSSAIASSCPGSQSMRSGVATKGGRLAGAELRRVGRGRDEVAREVGERVGGDVVGVHEDPRALELDAQLRRLPALRRVADLHRAAVALDPLPRTGPARFVLLVVVRPFGRQLDHVDRVHAVARAVVQVDRRSDRRPVVL